MTSHSAPAAITAAGATPRALRAATPLEVLTLPPRVPDVLRRNGGITTVEKLEATPDADLLFLPRIGPGTVAQVRAAVWAYRNGPAGCGPAAAKVASARAVLVRVALAYAAATWAGSPPHGGGVEAEQVALDAAADRLTALLQPQQGEITTAQSPAYGSAAGS